MFDTILSTALDVLPAVVGVAAAPSGVGTVAAVVVAAHALAVAVVNLTPTPKDDEWLSKGYRVVEVLAGILSRKAKQ